MKIIKPSAVIEYPYDMIDVANIYHRIENAGRTCYISQRDVTDFDRTRKFIRKLIESGHEAVIEHASMTVRFTVDRGVSHEIVRHRVASFAQESTRYCNYSKDKFGNELTFIDPCFWEKDSEMYKKWTAMMRTAEVVYMEMISNGAKPEEARTVLPNSLKTELVMTANIREWRHFFKLRAAGTTGKPHPQMVEVALPLLEECKRIMPELFDDIEVKTWTL